MKSPPEAERRIRRRAAAVVAGILGLVATVQAENAPAGARGSAAGGARAAMHGAPAAGVGHGNAMSAKLSAPRASVPASRVSVPKFLPQPLASPVVAGLSGRTIKPSSAGRVGGAAPYDPRHGAVIGGAAIGRRR